MSIAALIAAVAAPFAKDWISSESHKIKDIAGDQLYKAGSALTRSIRAGYDTANQSLVSYSAPGRVEPLCFIDADCAQSPMLSNVAQAALSMFTGHYLRAFAMDNATIGGVTAAARLSKFSTHRQADYLGALGLESLDDHLPFPQRQKTLPPEWKGVALEAQSVRVNPQRQREEEERRRKENVDTFREATGGQIMSNGTTKVGDLRSFDAASNLAIGKLINVEIRSEGVSVTVPVIVRMNIMTVPSDTMVHIYTSTSRDISMATRWKEFWHGKIDFWKDFVFCNDLVDAHAKNLRNDKNGFYRMMIDRRNNNMQAALVSGVPAINTASSVLILSSQTAAHIAAQYGGDLSNYKTRQKFFEQSYSMIIAVIDDRFGTTRFYTRDINEYTEVNARELEMSSKGTGPDIGDILAAYRVGSSPTL